MANITNEEILKAAGEAVDTVAEAAGEVVKRGRKVAGEATKRGRKAAGEAAKRGRKAAEPAVEKARKAAGEAKRAVPQKPEVYLQYDFKEADVNALVNAAREAFHAAKGRAAVRSCKLYLKPQENAAYYVINEEFTGKLDL